MDEIVPRTVQIIFVSDQKQFVQVLQKKSKSDYLLNVNKVMRDKFGQEIFIPNKIQSFLINYEIKKIIDKAVNVRNRKYKRIIYINSNLTANTILNTLDFLSTAYDSVQFEPLLIDLDSVISSSVNIKTLKKGQ